MRSGTTWTYFLTDHLGSVVATTDSTGAVLAQTRYTEFGEVRTDVGTVTQTDFGYTFQRNIADMGLMDYKARFYSSLLGRFVQPDSLVPGAANPQMFNRYAYVKNNPINFSDPSGHKESGECGYQGEDCGGSLVSSGDDSTSDTNWASYGLGAFIQFSNDVTGGLYYDLIGGEPNGENESFQRGRQAGRAASTAFAGTLAIKGIADTAAGVSALGASSGPAVVCELFTGGGCTVIAGPVLAGEGALVLGGVAESAWATGVFAYIKGNPLSNGGSGNSAQWKKLSNAEIKKLEDYYHEDVESIKTAGGKGAGSYNLYKDRNGDVYIKPNGGTGPGEFTGLNVYEANNN